MASVFSEYAASLEEHPHTEGQFIPEDEGVYSLEGSHMDKQPRAIEMRPLERYAGRYETEVSLPNEDDNITVKSKVQGESLNSYEGMVNLEEGIFRANEAWRQRPSNDTTHGENYAYDSDAHKDGEPMSYSDVTYAQIAEAIKEHGEQYGISHVNEFKLEHFIVEQVLNKPTQDTFSRLVGPDSSEDFQKGSDGFDAGMKTPFGKALNHLLQQRYPHREVVAIGADRGPIRILEGVVNINLTLQFYVEEKR